MNWQNIVQHARVQRPKYLGYVAGIAAAGLVIGGVAYGSTRGDDKALGSAGTKGSSTSTTDKANSTDTAKTTDPGAKTIARGEPTPGSPANNRVPSQSPVPKSFTALSVSSVPHDGGSNMFVLGSSDCGGGVRCPALIGTTDAARSWHLVNSFKANKLPVATTRQGAVQAGNVLSQVRFATAKIGWVFGGDILYTNDGGKTFREYTHLGASVIDVETDGNKVVVTGADRCRAALCAGPGYVAQAKTTDLDATLLMATVPPGPDNEGSPGEGSLGDLQVTFDSNQPYVSPSWDVAPAKGFGPQRVNFGHLSPLGKLDGTCGNPNSQQLVATEDEGGGLFAFCPAAGGGAAGSSAMAVFRSTNQGKTWSTVSADKLLLVNAGGTRSFAAANPKNLVAVSGGSSDLHGSMKVSHDGGKTWVSPTSPPPIPSHGWSWVGNHGGDSYYAVSGDAVPAFWKSDDDGRTWEKMALRP